MNGPELVKEQDGSLGADQLSPEEQEFERALSHAMRRLDAPVNFADTVRRRAEAGDRAPARVVAMSARWKSAQAWAAGAIAAGLALGVGVQTYHRHTERAEATRQFEVATEIEQQAMTHAREKLAQRGISLEQ